MGKQWGPLGVLRTPLEGSWHTPESLLVALGPLGRSLFSSLEVFFVFFLLAALGALLGALGTLCASLVVLWGAFGLLLARSWVGLGRSWGPLGQSWGGLGTVLGALGVGLTKNTKKSKRYPKFSAILEGKMEAKIHKNQC